MVKEFKKLLEEIENEKICKKCRRKRQNFQTYDYKEVGSYCPPLLGCWKGNLEYPSIPIDVLIVAESHGGGNWSEHINKNIRERINLNYYYHYIKEKESFFQYNIKKIIDGIEKEGLFWYFTDLVKCYVFKNKKKSKETKELVVRGGKNFDIAISECKSVLKKQIDILKPRIILSLGKRVKETLLELGVKEDKIISYPFPGQWTVNEWAKKDGYEGAIKEIRMKLERYKKKDING